MKKLLILLVLVASACSNADPKVSENFSTPKHIQEDLYKLEVAVDSTQTYHYVGSGERYDYYAQKRSDGRYEVVRSYYVDYREDFLLIMVLFTLLGFFIGGAIASDR